MPLWTLQIRISTLGRKRSNMDTIFQLTWHLPNDSECFFFHGQTNLSFISDGAPLMTEAAFAFNEKGVV